MLIDTALRNESLHALDQAQTTDLRRLLNDVIGILPAYTIRDAA